VETYAESLKRASDENRLTEIPGIGKAIAEKITELLNTGTLPFYEELKSEFPATLFDLFDLQGLGAKKIAAVYRELGVESIEQLEAACKDGRVAELPGFGKKTAANLIEAIEQRKGQVGQFLLSDATLVAEMIYDDLRQHPEISQLVNKHAQIHIQSEQMKNGIKAQKAAGAQGQLGDPRAQKAGRIAS
jgi:DNA polymerase (family 10)